MAPRSTARKPISTRCCRRRPRSIYKRTQPYRYAVYLMYDLSSQKKTWADAVPILRGLTSDPNPVERSWAYIGLGNIARYNQRDIFGSQDDFRRALAANPRSVIAFFDLSGNEVISSRRNRRSTTRGARSGSCSRPIRALPVRRWPFIASRTSD
ncbi:MAG: hypothetical protein WDM89_18500 [Rhizomicrobium sp.]